MNSALDQLLSETPAEAADREGAEFDRLSASCSGLVIFGAGNMGRTVVGKLRTAGIQPLAFTDNNAELWGRSVEGVPVLAPSDAVARFGAAAAFVVAIWGVNSRDRMAARVRQMRDLGCRVVIPFPALFWRFPELFLPYHMIDQPRKVLREAAAIRSVYGLWSDEFSRREFDAQIRWRLRADFDALSDPVPQTAYFPVDLFSLTAYETFIDCGAFDGDTTHAFLAATRSRFDRIVAFEPDPANFTKLSQAVTALAPGIAARIELHPKATGASNGRVRFAALGTDGSSIGAGDLEVDCVALDEALSSMTPTLIKMDIEGAELDALEGARGSIARHSPVLAICAYHHQSDIWRIPALIHSVNADYRLYLRPHKMEGWDAVCYAVPPERAIR